MWAFRRASIPCRSRGFSIGISHVSCAKSEITSPIREGNIKSPEEAYHRHLSLKGGYQTPFGSSKFSVGRHAFSSQAGAKSNGEEDDLEDRFSELEMPSSAEANGDGNGEGEDDEALVSGPELSEDDVEEASQNELKLDFEADRSERKLSMKRAHSALFKAILDSPGFSVRHALNKWVEEGNDLSRTEIWLAMFNLRNYQMYVLALQLSEWLEANKHVDFVERDYASRVDLIAKVHGIQQAEEYIENIPQHFRGEVIYRTLLSNCVLAADTKKAEELFNKMQDLGFPITAFACNQLLLLYQGCKGKILGDVLLLMEKENVKPTRLTYGILIDVKCRSNDITGMDQIVQIMNDEGIEPDIKTQATIARHYVSAGLTAEAILGEMEGENLRGRWICRLLFPLYAKLGRADEVHKVWKVCELNPRLDECEAAIDAWGELGNIEEAEAVFDRMSKTGKRLFSRHYAVLLKAYAKTKMVSKGEDLIKQMEDSGCKMGPLTWDALVKLYMEAGDVEMADYVLEKLEQQSHIKPFFSSYMAIMEQYARRGDVHNSEKIFNRMREVGYVGRPSQFRVLLQAYIYAKVPAYGMRDRMKADNLFPREGLTAQLAKVDVFRRNALSDLLD